ncbi:MAG: multidrug effflux MFS transporter [Actinobacteria bacterium]|nr:multidrug effflux MFS transporter [Actinomycetota bacterium]
MQPAPAPAAVTAGRVTWPLLVVLASLAAVAPIATDLYLPGFPEMGAALAAPPSGVQLTLTTFLVGLAVGQLVTGPLSDRFGRRRPLVLTTAASVAAGAVCALAPNLPVLAGARFVAGLAGAGGLVIGRAVIADLVEGRAAARAFTLMLTVGGVAPVLAPLVGGLLVGQVGWRGLLWTVVALCVAMLAGVLLVVPETLPEQARGGERLPLRRAVRTVLGRPGYAAPMAVFALAFGVMMAYIAASPFVYRNVLGLSAVGYGVMFGVNAAGLTAAGALSARFVDRVDPARIVRAALVVQVAATVGFAALAAASAPSWTYAVAIWVAVVANGGILGNASALAMGHVRDVAGSGSAVLGFAQFVLGALVSPLVGLGGETSALVPALVMAGASVLALGVSRRL